MPSRYCCSLRMSVGKLQRPDPKTNRFQEHAQYKDHARPRRPTRLLTWDGSCVLVPRSVVRLHLWCKLLQQSLMLLL